MTEEKKNTKRKTIIANYGDPNVGKTKSILMAYEKLKKVETSKSGFVPHYDNDDICDVLVINEIKVGICSQGDPRSCQKGWMDILVNQQKCTIILAACRYMGATTTLIESYHQKGYRIYWTCNARLYERNTDPRVAPKGIQTRFNDHWATEIANLIESWCYAGREKKN